MKKPILIAGLLVLVALLAGAMFVGAQLLAAQGQPTQGGKQAQMLQDQTIPAKELPQTPADVRSVLDHRKDNSLFVGTGVIISSLQKDQSGNVTSSSSYSGPIVELVVTPQTIFYRDVTARQFIDGQRPSGRIQQVVEPGSLDEIGKDSLIHAWGKKTGDRIIADVIVYVLPSVGGPSIGG